MITLFLLIYTGVQISAPWWYYTLVGISFLIKVLGFGIKWGEKVGEHSDD